MRPLIKSPGRERPDWQIVYMESESRAIEPPPGFSDVFRCGRRSPAVLEFQDLWRQWESVKPSRCLPQNPLFVFRGKERDQFFHDHQFKKIRPNQAAWAKTVVES